MSAKKFLFLLFLVGIILFLFFQGISFVAGGVSIVCSIILFESYFKQKKWKKVRNANYLKYEYWRDTKFEHIEPVYAGYLLGVNKVNISSIVATMFVLEEKGIVKIDIVDKDYYISLIKGFDTREYSELKNYERKILELFFDKLENKSNICLRERLEFFDKHYDYKVIFEDIYKQIREEAERKFYTSEREDENLELQSIPTVNLVFGLLLVILSASTDWFLFNLICYIINGIAFFVELRSTKIIKSEYMDEINKLQGLYNFLISFSNMKDQELKYVKIYEKFYIYAISFGIADRAEYEFKQKELDNLTKTNIQVLLDNDKIKSKVMKSDLNGLLFAVFCCSGFLMPVFLAEWGNSFTDILIQVGLCTPLGISLIIYIRAIIKNKKIEKIRRYEK